MTFKQFAYDANYGTSSEFIYVFSHPIGGSTVEYGKLLSENEWITKIFGNGHQIMSKCETAVGI